MIFIDSQRKRVGTNPIHEDVVSVLDEYHSTDFPNKDTEFCDLHAGNGDFIVQVYKRKLQHWHDPLQALATIFAIDEDTENVVRIKARLIDFLPDTLHYQANKIMNKNIICHNGDDWDIDGWCPKDELPATSRLQSKWFEW